MRSTRATGAHIRQLVESELGGPIDLVIDDASHAYHPTLLSFEALFPLLRSGGCYAIEDWAWAHVEVPENMRHLVPPGPPMSRLMFELMMVMGSYAGVVDRIEGDASTQRIWRGDASIALDWSLAGAWTTLDQIIL